MFCPEILIISPRWTRRFPIEAVQAHCHGLDFQRLGYKDVLGSGSGWMLRWLLREYVKVNIW